jgi:hypothetical protein
MPTDPQNETAALDTTEDSASTPARKAPGRDPRLIERDELLASMDAKIEARRQEEHDQFLRSVDVDPRAAAFAAAMEKEAQGEGQELPVRKAPVPEVRAEAIKPDAAEVAAAEAVRISNKGDDPLGDYVVRVEGKPMFKTLVDGKERLIPLNDARAQLQKHLAADIRLQTAAERQRQLDAREAAIRQTEATLATRSQPPAPAAVDDRALASGLVRSLVSEPEDKAVEKMAQVFKSLRQAPAPVDANAIAKAAAAEVRREIAESENQKALQSGLSTFTKSYPDIAADSDLFNLADRKTETIASEYPEWSPEQVMLEAGKQVREWLTGLGAPAKVAPPAGQQTSNRQQRKQNLVPMPQPRSVRPVAAADEPGQTPQEAMAEIRKSRGQLY